MGILPGGKFLKVLLIVLNPPRENRRVGPEMRSLWEGNPCEAAQVEGSCAGSN